MKKPLYVFLILFCLILSPPGFTEEDPLGDIGLFMSKVIANRDRMRRLLASYSYMEKENIILADRSGRTVFAHEGIYRWTFQEDGIPVRVPQELNGKALSEKEKEIHREKWLKAMEKTREQRERFKDNRDLFLNCPFDPENYYFVDLETLKGYSVVKVENIPQSSEEPADDLDKILQGASILMWVEPETFQMVRIEISHLNLDVFSALKLFVNIEEAALQVNMKEFRQEIWLPADLHFQARVKTFEDVLTLQYTTEYYDYGKFTVSSDFEFKEK